MPTGPVALGMSHGPLGIGFDDTDGDYLSNNDLRNSLDTITSGGTNKMDVIYLDPVSQIAEIRYPQDCMTCYSCEVECPVDAVFVDPIKNPKPQAW